MFKETEYDNLTKSEKALKRFAEKLIAIGIVCFFISLFTFCFIGLFTLCSNSSALILICKASFIVTCVCLLSGVFLYGLSIADHVSL